MLALGHMDLDQCNPYAHRPVLLFEVGESEIAPLTLKAINQAEEKPVSVFLLFTLYNIPNPR